MTIKTFVFNPFQLNTYLLYDESLEGIIIDAGNSNQQEDAQLFDFVEKEGIQIKGLYYTHAHVDHIVGNNAILKHFNCKSFAHYDSIVFFEQAPDYGKSLGFNISELILPEVFINEDSLIKFGNSKLKVIHTPGHADGSLCFYSMEDQFVIVGDVLFRGSIGRTDLPTGDFDLLAKSIIEKLYSLPSATKVYSGHGPTTSIGYEKVNNPFVNLV